MARTLEATGLTRLFGRHRAVDGVGFSLDGGESLALFGPNGAGKTTLLRLLAGLLRPTAGEASIAGANVRGDAEVRGRVGLISHQTMLYPALTALENVEFAARLHGVADPVGSALGALERLGIAQRKDSAVKTLSRGMQQRVSIARSIVHSPVLLLLDEPYTGLDASGAAALSDLLGGLRSAGAAMLLVTHNIPEGLAVATHAAIMRGGKLVKLAPTAGLDPDGFAAEYRETAGAGAVAA